MRKKEVKLVITFYTTMEAMAMEDMCQEAKLIGRLIPVPRSISAGCGLAWAADLQDREALLALIKERNLEIEEVHECLV